MLQALNRDIKDIVRNNPLAVLVSEDGNLSVAGSNPRFNSITVDGIGQNDDFGLNAMVTQHNVHQFLLMQLNKSQLILTPFNAKDGGFSGGKINAVTKSGTNEFQVHFSMRHKMMAWLESLTIDGNVSKL